MQLRHEPAVLVLRASLCDNGSEEVRAGIWSRAAPMCSLTRRGNPEVILIHRAVR